MYEAIINAIQKVIGYEGETEIIVHNPDSMLQVAQTMLDTIQTQIFIILERAHELAYKQLSLNVSYCLHEKPSLNCL